MLEIGYLHIWSIGSSNRIVFKLGKDVEVPEVPRGTSQCEECPLSKVKVKYQKFVNYATSFGISNQIIFKPGKCF
jgi:hypothetical protein